MMSTFERLAFWVIAASLPAIAAPSPTAPGSIRSYSTIRSLGIEWDITGDTNHNATCAVQFRKQGESAWRAFVPLFRVDFRGWYDTDTADRAYNMLAGSVMFLDPGSAYEVKLGLSDPDGGSRDTSLTITTRPVPALPAGGRTLHVAAGTGSGDGSAGNPFKGLAAAQTAAQAGDIIMVHAGGYGNFTFGKSGTAAAYLVWKAAGDGDAMLDYGHIAASHVWLQGLHFVNNAAQTYALVGQSASPANVVTRCAFNGFSYSITMQSGSDDWYIADNTIVGDKTNPRAVGDFDGEGIELEHTNGHTVCYNSISRTADGVSYMNRNCDIFGNEIFDVVDDGIEPDYGYANVRVWENRITNPRNHGFSFQPMFCGPWYFVRNQVMGMGCYMLKWRVVDRVLLAHNTFVGWNTMDIYDQNILAALSRNNLWIQAGGSGYIWEAMTCNTAASCTQPERWTPDWRTIVDYDGFDWASSSPVFKWGASVNRYSDLATFSSAVGIETHGRRVTKADLFDSLDTPGADSLCTRHYLTLRPGCGAIDKGDRLAGINDDYAGSAPDLGAYETTMPLPHYGPRPEDAGPVVCQPAIAPGVRRIAAWLTPRAGGRGIDIRFRTSASGVARVAVRDLSGRLVATPLRREVGRGDQLLSWPGRTPGIYVIVIEQGEAVLTSRAVVR